MKGTGLSDRQLIDMAKRAMTNAIASSSGFNVGVTLLAGDGRVFTGCNIENPSLMLTICAERVALYKALSEGVRDFARVVILANKNPCFPCGSCRQLLLEFAPGVEVVVVGARGGVKRFRIERLLPKAFKISGDSL
ncbi:MAG: cytidine deaminase [Deltaproteobacteria bacterium]|nr:cytidine deaminase [Deltaproteobacteria bacterium]